jgi:hypothetical protein
MNKVDLIFDTYKGLVHYSTVMSFLRNTLCKVYNMWNSVCVGIDELIDVRLHKTIELLKLIFILNHFDVG